MGVSMLKDQGKPQPKEVINHRTEVMAAVVVPARLESTRFPDKALLYKTGRPLFAHTLDLALKVHRAVDVGLITDSRRIYQACRSIFPRQVLALLHEQAADCGTQRVWNWLEHFEGLDTYDVVVNLQCDEPCVDSRDIDNLIMACSVSQQISTLVAPFATTQAGRVRRVDVNCVKAWKRGDRLHDFSREYPYNKAAGKAWEHIGVYAFPAKLFHHMRWNRSNRAKQCSLEQLTWIDEGDKIFAVEAKHTQQVLSINTPADYAKFCRWAQARKECEAPK